MFILKVREWYYKIILWAKNKKQSISEQTLQATQWIAADSLSKDTKKKKGLTPVHELYGKTYTAMAKNIIHTFRADPKMAGLIQAGLDAVYDSQTDVNMVVNGIAANPQGGYSQLEGKTYPMGLDDITKKITNCSSYVHFSLEFYFCIIIIILWNLKLTQK